jgi:hypothetical protein
MLTGAHGGNDAGSQAGIMIEGSSSSGTQCGEQPSSQTPGEGTDESEEKETSEREEKEALEEMDDELERESGSYVRKSSGRGGGLPREREERPSRSSQ